MLEDSAKQFALPSMTCPVTGKSVEEDDDVYDGAVSMCVGF